MLYRHYNYKYNPEKFEQIKSLGSGAFGETFLVKEKETGFPLVLKKIGSDLTPEYEAKTEVDILRKLKPVCEPNILCYIDYFKKKGKVNREEKDKKTGKEKSVEKVVDLLNIVTEYLDGYTTLDKFISDHEDDNQYRWSLTPSTFPAPT